MGSGTNFGKSLSMRVRISDISPKGLEVKGEIPLVPLNDRMKAGENQEIIFSCAPIADLMIFGNSSGAELTGTISAKYKQACSLCLDVKERSVNIKTKFHLKEKTDPKAEDDDIGIVYYENDLLELDPILEEALILSLALYWHPPFDKKERCTECEKSRSELGLAADAGALKLGDLLKEKLKH